MKNKEEKVNFMLKEAFKLFLRKEYANVTTGDLEEATGISRGSIYYRTKNKEGLYKAVIDKFVFDFLLSDKNEEATIDKKKPFHGFLCIYLENIEKRMSDIKADIKHLNVSYQYVNMFASACFHYPEFQEKYKDVEDLIVEQWKQYYRLGVEVGELKDEYDMETTIAMFRSLYYGDSFIQSIIGEGLNTKNLKNKYILLYNFIKA